ncbi:hypothetical protein LTR95_005277, partial [Oleoguttula sp. CCFEE 5521]
SHVHSFEVLARCDTTTIITMYPNPGVAQYTGLSLPYGPPTPGHDTPNPSTPSVRDSRSTDQTDSSNHTSWTSPSPSRPSSNSTSKFPCTACWKTWKRESLATHYRTCSAINKDGLDLWACAICPHAPYYNRDAYVNHLHTHNPNHGGVPIFDHVNTPYLSVGVWITVHYESAIKRQISNLFHGLVWRDPSLVEKWQSINNDALLPLYYNFDALKALELSQTLQSPSERTASTVFERLRKLQDPLPSTPASTAHSTGLGIYSQSQYSSLPPTSSGQHDTRWDTGYYAYGRGRNDSIQQQWLSPMSSPPPDPPIYEQSNPRINSNALNADTANCPDPVRPANFSQPVQASLGDASGQPQHRPIYHDPHAPHQLQQENPLPVQQLGRWSASQSQHAPSMSDQEQRWLQSAGQEAQNRRQTNIVYPGQHYGQGDDVLSSFMDI